jgi:hypothetical protein
LKGRKLIFVGCYYLLYNTTRVRLMFFLIDARLRDGY